MNTQILKLKKEGLSIIRRLHNSSVYLCRINGKEVIYKEPREGEREYEVVQMVNKIVNRGYNKKFKVLILPKFYEINKKIGYLLIEYCGSNDDIKRGWESEGLGGGRDMQLRLSKEMADIIYDFSKIKLKDLEGWRDFLFDFSKAKVIFLEKLVDAYKREFITRNEMEKKMVSRDNAMFFVAAVGMSLGTEFFAQAVLDSSMEMSQFPTDNVGYPGYIRIDSSAIRNKGEDCWYEFVDKVRGSFLTSVSYGFSSATKFEGDLAERVTLRKDGYTFAFHIQQYERDANNGFAIIDTKDLVDIPENEKLGRVVYLIITFG